MRLNNYISSSGICSRREADKWIKEKKVKVNGKLADVGTKVSEDDVVEVMGKTVKPKQNKVYIAFNKPVGITCTTESHIKGNIVDFINHKERIFPIGRLDKDSQGLILLTNDGSIVNEILREENNHEKDYIVTVDKPIIKSFLVSMSKGVKIFNPVQKKYVITKSCKVEKINDKTFKITLSQGLNRQIRRMCEVLGYKVIRLKRVRIMNIKLNGIPEGTYRNLSEEELKILKEHTKNKS
ncbi:23S rRNA pseudouridine2604 synthase [Acetoanaerobium pronyense]|uniref:Pseudouridine synthase n=1 Tax=Acetoanaerobium pronyense TaxID=1482736 RepID=A0ABS4KHF0_9FIRM|nr:pseudouridine synthase [Acetoanaerobium pronyense]MBP2027212.1 23S rRNA pseudouridine2604 synthase [Acetoanaerobium pronyense]